MNPLTKIFFFGAAMLLASNVFAQSPAPCEEPYPQVQNLQASVETQSVELTWDPILGSLGCRVQLRQAGNTAWQTATFLQPDLDAFSISGSFLEYQTDYEARVACGCSANPVIIGAYSEIVSFSSGSTGQQVPCENPYPEVLNPSSAPSAENDAIVLSWDPIPQSLGCQIEYSLLEGGVLNTAQVFESELSSFSIPEGDLIPNQDYEWRVRCGCSLNPLVAGPWIEFQEFNSGGVGELSLPVADFTVSEECTVENQEITFSPLIQDESLDYFWNFGDGTSSDEISPTKTYSEPGIFSVSLTTTNSLAQAVEVKIDFIEVNPSICPDFILDATGNSYGVVQICNQCWITENLKAQHYANGDPIQFINDQSTWAAQNPDGVQNSSYSYWNFNSSFVETYGNLYNFYAANDSRNVCPSGWHVPTDNDFKVLEENLGLAVDELDLSGFRENIVNLGGKLKSTDNWNSPNTGANNSSGFSAVPGGELSNSAAIFVFLGETGRYWTASVNDDGIASWTRRLDYDSEGIFRGTRDPDNGLSIRCIQD